MNFLILFSLLIIAVSGNDLTRKSFCSSRDFRLDCNRTSMLAIHEAFFTNEPSEVSNVCCDEVQSDVPLCTEDVRTALNTRCSGMSHCHFNLTQDYPQRKCPREGVIKLVYACVSDELISRFCNVKVKGPWGYIASPGYPRFYPKVSECSWTIESSEDHELILTTLDLSIRPRKTSSRGLHLCLSDSLTILEGRYKLRQDCDDADNETRKPLLTNGKEITVRFSSEDFSPARGFLLYYRFHGCPTLAAPEFGYMVHRNRTSAFYMCCKDHIFSDSLQTTRLLHCIDDFRWNASVGSCLTLDEISALNKNSTLEVTDEGNSTEVSSVVGVYLSKPKYFEDVLIPAASVVGLLFGNVAAILVIIRIRKRRKSSGSNQGLHRVPPRTSTANSVPRAPQVLMSDL